MGRYYFVDNEDTSDANDNENTNTNTTSTSNLQLSRCNTRPMVQNPSLFSSTTSYNDTTTQHNQDGCMQYVIIDRNNTSIQANKRNNNWISIFFIILISWMCRHMPNIHNHYQHNDNTNTIKNIILSWQFGLKLCYNDLWNIKHTFVKSRKINNVMKVSQTKFEENALNAIIGQDYGISTLVSYVDEWQTKKSNNALILLLTGPDHVGKTSTMHLLHNHIHLNTTTNSDILHISGDEYTEQRFHSLRQMQQIQQELLNDMISYNGYIIIIHNFDKIILDIWMYVYYQIIIPFLNKQKMIIVLESSHDFGKIHMYYDFRSSHGILDGKRNFDKKVIQSLDHVCNDIPWNNMIHVIVPFLPLTHVHLKHILQNHTKTYMKNVHVSENAIHYLLSSSYIDYFTLQNNNQEENDEIIYATNGVQHLFSDSIRIIKRLLQKHSNNDTTDRLLVLDYNEDNDMFVLTSCKEKGLDCIKLWSGKKP